MRGISRRQFITVAGVALAGGVASGCGVREIGLGLLPAEAENNDAKGTSPGGDGSGRAGQPVAWETLIVNGLIVDGTGVPAFAGAVAVEKGRIAAVLPAGGGQHRDGGRFFSAGKSYLPPPECQVIDAQGAYVTPGFIDIHTHNEVYLGTNPQAEVRLLQGVTAQVGGNCGDSVDSIAAFRHRLGSLGVNYAQLVGYRNLRRQALGDDANRPATAVEMEGMIGRLEEGLDEGAPGLSIALEYAPQSAVSVDELEQYAQVLARRGKLLTVHLRSEGKRVLEALEEVLAVARRTGVALQYSHVKALFAANWDKYPRILESLDAAVAEGVDVWGDMYVYDFSSWDFGTDRVSIAEDNILQGLAHPRLFIASDSGLYENGRANHPRAYGNFSRVLARYVRDKQALSLETAVAKMSDLPARRFGYTERGRLVAGNKADLLIFSLDAVEDCATRQEPAILAEGMRYVFVNGVKAVDGGAPTGALAGEWL
ncbi:amidohydrolase family protein [Heliobacterium gestii]|uniref:Amidohydrolase family protein n=1 Tax=Heliomicrobium gestii TaxID=2699 RepID=A0A845LE66_HELGE|nr:amidohydrolase family protein [Heliomicrobium gestii]MBM7866499.1 N-acyl-D-aspartate/D-glutamate deacylase [Heliomicrobium gestii]MZP43220.1 amidohydrolase family protein [Heliomicrobium gestii]